MKESKVKSPGNNALTPQKTDLDSTLNREPFFSLCVRASKEQRQHLWACFSLRRDTGDRMFFRRERVGRRKSQLRETRPQPRCQQPGDRSYRGHGKKPGFQTEAWGGTLCLQQERADT